MLWHCGYTRNNYCDTHVIIMYLLKVLCVKGGSSCLHPFKRALQMSVFSCLVGLAILTFEGFLFLFVEKKIAVFVYVC